MAEPERCGRVRAGACNWTDSDRMGPKSLGNTEIRNIGLQLLLDSRGRIENNPGGAGTPCAGVDHAPSLHEIEGEVSTILPSLAGLTDSERRKLLIHLLDDVRQRYDAVRSSRHGLMVLARDDGMSCRDIGTVLGISEQSARDQINRAKAKGGGA